MNRKLFSGSLKAMDEKGVGQAVFATMDVWDKDGEWTTPGAFGEQTVKLVGAHDWKAPNIGVAKIREEGVNAVADFQFYLDMPSAKEWYTALKNNFDNGVDQQYSYGFDVLEESKGEKEGRTGRILSKLKVYEVSPVMVGAGIATRTTAMKGEKELEGSWESIQESIGNAAEDLLMPPPDMNGYATGYVSLEGTFDKSCVVRLYVYQADEPQYFQFDWSMQPDGSVILTNQQEVELSVIITQKSLPIKNHFRRVLGEVNGLAYRSKALAALRAKEGRVLSTANRTRLTSLLLSLTSVHGEIEKLLAETAVTDEGKAQIFQMYGEFQKIQSQLTGQGGA